MLTIYDDQAGQSLVEYAFILLLVALVVVLVLIAYGATLGNMFSRVTYQVGQY